MKDKVLIYNPKDLVSVLKFWDCPNCGGEVQKLTKPEHTDTGYKLKIQCPSCKKMFWKIISRMEVPDKVKITYREIEETKDVRMDI